MLWAPKLNVVGTYNGFGLRFYFCLMAGDVFTVYSHFCFFLSSASEVLSSKPFAGSFFPAAVSFSGV